MLSTISTWAKATILLDEDAAVTRAENAPTRHNVQFARESIKFVTLAGNNYNPGELVNYYGKHITLREKLEHLLLRLERITPHTENTTYGVEMVPLTKKIPHLGHPRQNHHDNVIPAE